MHVWRQQQRNAEPPGGAGAPGDDAEQAAGQDGKRPPEAETEAALCSLGAAASASSGAGVWRRRQGVAGGPDPAPSCLLCGGDFGMTRQQAWGLARRLLGNHILWGCLVGIVLSLSKIGPKWLSPGAFRKRKGWCVEKGRVGGAQVIVTPSVGAPHALARCCRQPACQPQLQL